MRNYQFKVVRGSEYVVLFLLLNCFFCFSVFSQDFDDWLTTTQPPSIQRIYLHCDRDFYFLRETIWFRAYLFDGYTNQLFGGEENIFVDLADEKGEIVTKVNLLAVNGLVSGYINLPDSLQEGSYWIRAYTEYLRNFGEEAFFYRPVKISGVKNSFEISDSRIKQKDKNKIVPDVSFLPEGGYLLAGVTNCVAVKAVDPSGKGISVKGSIRDEKGNSVVSFGTGYRGIGLIYYVPDSGKTYHAELNDYPGNKYPLSNVHNKGAIVQLVRQDSVEVVIHVVTDSGTQSDRFYYLVGMFRGTVQFYKQFQINDSYRIFRISKNYFPGGINRLLLLSRELQPVSERLFFSDNYSINNLDLLTDSGSYPTRSEIKLHIRNGSTTSVEEISRMSVAVVDENAANSGGPSQNLLSYLLLDAELKGYIESPADFFISDSIPSSRKLDLLMLTHGWRNYFWNTLPGNNDSLKFKYSSGIQVRGRAERIIGKKPIQNGEVIAGIFKKDNVSFLTGITDESGKFSFEGIYFSDTASVFVQVRNEKGKKSTEVILDPAFEHNLPVPGSWLAALGGFSDIPLELYRRKFYNDLSLREFNPDTGSILLGEVRVVKEKKEEDDGHFRIYGTPDNMLKITDRDISYSDVISYLSGRVAGLYISGNTITIRGINSFYGSSTPLFLLDGMPIEGEGAVDFIRSVPMSDIDKVEVLKTPSNTAMFGSRGANGVIAVYTKRGVPGKTNDYLIGAITQKIIGYQSNREFYSPKYTPDNINSPVPDYRTTLYWNPDVTTVNGEVVLVFFSCDNVTGYRIFTEGITTGGKICLGKGSFLVDRFRENPEDQ